MTGASDLLLDANVLVYGFDQNEPVKGPAARHLLLDIFAAGRPLLTTQVLAEFYWNVTRKIPSRLDHAAALVEVQRFQGLATVVPVTWSLLEKAFEAIANYGIPLWDAQIFAAAVLHGATTIVSEDFQHRQCLEGVTFINPFATDFVLTDILKP